MAHGQRHIADPRGAMRHSAQLQGRAAECDLAFRKNRRDLAPDHQPNEVVTGDGFARPRGHRLSVAQHRDAIGDRGNLLEPVRDVDHAGAVVAQTRDRGEELRRLPIGEGRGRLVHDQHARVGTEGLGDLDHLLLGHAQRVDTAFGVDRGPYPRQQIRGTPGATGPIDPPPRAPTFEGERDVLGHGQIGEERGLLVDGRDAERARERGRHLGHPPAVHVQRARVGDDGAGHDLDERALAGPVLSHQGVHFASTQVERHAFEGPGALVGLGDRGRLKQALGHGSADDTVGRCVFPAAKLPARNAEPPTGMAGGSAAQTGNTPVLNVMRRYPGRRASRLCRLQHARNNRLTLRCPKRFSHNGGPR